jgi:Asp-tRNA(Asn)/Glu-tRNA(Gln) amidotransferase A subunit family amidase
MTLSLVLPLAFSLLSPALAQDEGTAESLAAVEVLSVEHLRAAMRLSALEFSEEELSQMLDAVQGQIDSIEDMRRFPITNSDAPSNIFIPIRTTAPPLPELQPIQVAEGIERPSALSELYFADIPTLAALIKAREVSCVELAELFTARLQELDPTLHFLINLTSERAMKQAEGLDAELDAGEYRGLLHGIPWGAKDLLAVDGYPTTWGAAPFKDQRLEGDAEVVRRLDAAGAVLIAKLTMGALAMGDVWYGETTRNPWNPEEGSSGSSAGSASATAAGCLPFAIGTETLGSIISPSTRCGNSSLRPSFGRVPRTGAMALCWSMDKIGPIARSAMDCAIVFEAIAGKDAADPSTLNIPAPPAGTADVKGWTLGFLSDERESDESYAQILTELEALGCELKAITIPEYPVWSMLLLLMAEAASAFDDFTRNNLDDDLVSQDADAWPNALRAARLIPAVDYIRADRLRGPASRELEAVLSTVDVFCHPNFAADFLPLSNYTGHPTVVCPGPFSEEAGQPTSVSFSTRLHDEAHALALAAAWQEVTVHNQRHPGTE